MTQQFSTTNDVTNPIIDWNTLIASVAMGETVIQEWAGLGDEVDMAKIWTVAGDNVWVEVHDIPCTPDDITFDDLNWTDEEIAAMTRLA